MSSSSRPATCCRAAHGRHAPRRRGVAAVFAAVLAAAVAGVFLGLLPGFHRPLEAGVSLPRLPFADANGDANGDGSIDLSDAIYLLQWRFAGGSPPALIRCQTTLFQNGDINGDGTRDISDAVALLMWLFTGGNPPVEPCAVPYDDVIIWTPDDPEILHEDPGAEPIEVPPDVVHLLRPQPIYRIRIHAIRTADDDGSLRATITDDEIAKLVEQANTVYYTAGVEFLFDPATDVEDRHEHVLNHDFTLLDDAAKYTSKSSPPPVDREPYILFQTAIADLHRGEITVYFRWGDELYYDDNAGHWRAGRRYRSSSSWAARYVNMVGFMPNDINVLAHELGHYLHNRHPFTEVRTLAAIRDRIRNYVMQGHPMAEGLNALDGMWDREWVLDTPPDAGPWVWNELELDPCTTDHLTFTVTFPFPLGTSRDYRLSPDRRNIMSYFNCGLYRRFTPQQITRLRTALEDGNRHDLVSLHEGDTLLTHLGLERRGNATDTAIDDVDIVRVSLNRVVTASMAGSTMHVVAWLVSDDGMTVTRQGEATAGPVSAVAACPIGLRSLVTAVRDSEGDLKLIVWRVGPSGEIERLGSAGAGAVGKVSICRVGIQAVATAVTNAGGNLEVIFWRLTADGTIERRASAEAGPVADVVASTVGNYSAATTVRDEGGYLRLIVWEGSYEGTHKISKIFRKDTDLAGAAGALAAAPLDVDVLAAAVQTGSGRLEVISWDINRFGQIRRKGSAVADATGVVDACRLGTDLLVTGRRNGAGNLELDLWDVDVDAGTVTHVAGAGAGAVSDLAMCRTGPTGVVTAVRTGSGVLELIVWRAHRLTISPR